MLLSIITINYNNKNGLKLTAESIANQTSHNFEWIVIDGGSTDGSTEIIEEYSTLITYSVSEKDNGIYNAMNKGIKQANGKYLLFLNSGDYLYNKDVVVNTSSYLKDNDLYIGHIVTENTKFLTSLPNQEITNEQFLNLLVFKCVPHPATFMKRELFEKFGLYDENLKIKGDWVYFFRNCFINKISIHSLPLYISFYDTNGVSSKNSSVMETDNLYFRNKWPGLELLINFYISNYNIIKVIRNSKFLMTLTKVWLKFFNK